MHLIYTDMSIVENLLLWTFPAEGKVLVGGSSSSPAEST